MEMYVFIRHQRRTFCPSVDSAIMVTMSLQFSETLQCWWGQALCPTQAPAWNLHSGLSQLSLSCGALGMGQGTEDPIQGFIHPLVAQGASRSSRTTLLNSLLCAISPTLSGSLNAPVSALGLLVRNPGLLFSKSTVHFLPPSLPPGPSDSRREKGNLLLEPVWAENGSLPWFRVPGSGPAWLTVMQVCLGPRQGGKARPRAPTLNLTGPVAILGQRERLFLEIFLSSRGTAAPTFEALAVA